MQQLLICSDNRQLDLVDRHGSVKHCVVRIAVYHICILVYVYLVVCSITIDAAAPLLILNLYLLFIICIARDKVSHKTLCEKEKRHYNSRRL